MMFRHWGSTPTYRMLLRVPTPASCSCTCGGTPADMRDRTNYEDLAEEVTGELDLAVVRAQESGIKPEAIVLDPGIGFAKTSSQSLRLLGEIPRLTKLGFPVMVGPSRKSFLGDLLGTPPKDRVAGTVAACLVAYEGGARIFRVHDVAATAQALKVVRAVEAELPAREPS